MKNPERVAELLAELRALAETPLEVAIIDRCERDLHEPPTVEIIDDKQQKFDGNIYTVRDRGHFSKRENFIHRAVWTYYFGEIPEGYEIHHIDENKANNDIENLLCLTKSEHHQIHVPQGTRVYKKIEQLECAYCGKLFTKTTPQGKYCSDQCHNAARRKNTHRTRQPLDERICAVCGKKFQVRRDKKQQCCSISCGNKLSFRERATTATCPICGKEFTRAKNSSKLYCSPNCALRAWRAKNKKD